MGVGEKNQNPCETQKNTKIPLPGAKMIFVNFLIMPKQNKYLVTQF